MKALVALGKQSEAIRYAEDNKGLNDPVSVIAGACEEILLSSGLFDEAYNRYALAVNQGCSLVNDQLSYTTCSGYPTKSGRAENLIDKLRRG